MRLQELFENEIMPDAELKAIIKTITLKTTKGRQNGSPGMKAFGPHKIVNGMVESRARELWIDNKMMDENGELLIPFRSCNAIQCRAMKLSSFKNFPLQILGRLITAFNTSEMHHDPEVKVSSLEGFPERIAYGFINLSNNKFSPISYSKVNRFIKYAESQVLIHKDYEGPLLSFLLIDRLHSVTKIESIHAKTPCKIVTAHLKADRDIMECQEELIQHGFKQYGKL